MSEVEVLQRKISELRFACSSQIRKQNQKVDRVASHFRQSFARVRDRAEQSQADKDDLQKLKNQLRELENNLNSAQSAKAYKDAKHKNTVESLLDTQGRIAELKNLVQNQRTRKDVIEALVSRQNHALEKLEEKYNQDNADKENIEAALLWYDKVLGFRTEGGEGVKFHFNKIDWENPDKEYSFAIRLEGDTYRLLQSDPILQDTAELIGQLNETNSFFKFVRAMREKFLATALKENIPSAKDTHPDSCSTTISSPPPLSEDSKTGFLAQENQRHTREEDCLPRKSKHRSAGFYAKSPQSASVTRRSPRFQNAP